MNFARSTKSMASSVFAKPADFVVFILTACLTVLVCSADPRDPKLKIYPLNQNPILAPAKESFGLMCEGKAEEGEFTDMKWFNPEGEEIRDNLRQIESMLKLTFPNPAVEDSGNYKCSALFSNTLTLEEEVQVDFYEPIKFEDCPEIQNLVIGQEGQIRCRAIANPRPTISWEKDGNPIKSDRVAISEFGISITSVSEEDEGIYSLEAFIKETGSNQVQKIEVNVLTPPKINDLPEEFLVIQGEEYTINCGAKGSEPLTFTWFDHNLRDLSQVDGYRVNGGLLTISRVEKNAAGDYMCRVTNPAGEDQATVKIEVHVRPYIQEMKNVTTNEGGNAVFECLGEGFPKPKMTIRRDNSPEDIVNNPEGGIELDVFDDANFNRLRLQLTNVKRTDDGLYYCKAANAAGVAERTGHLTVQFRPDMSRNTVTSVKTWNNNNGNLTCIAEAIPNATITWKFQNEPIDLSSGGRYEVRGTESYSNLLVKTEGMSDVDVYGPYTCEARNALGESSIVISLDKATRPSALTQIVFDKVTSTTITFRLMGPGNTGGMPITHYNMKYRLFENKDDPVKEVTWEKGDKASETPYILSNLIPRAKYQFSAAAINVVGVGDYKDAIYVMPEETVPEPPMIKTRQETVSEYPDRFEVRWDIPNNNGKPIMKYGIRYFRVERGLKDWTQMEKAVERAVDADELSFVMIGLMPDSYYKIEVRATNEIGNSLPESVVIKTSKGETNDGHTSLPDEEIPIPIIVAIVLVALFITLVILDVTCFFRYHCGLLYLMRYRTCGRSPEKVQATMEEGRACVKEVSTANNGKIKTELKSPSSPDQLPPPDKLSAYDEKPKTEMDNPAFENRDARPADLIIDENYKNKSPKGSKTSIGKSSPV